MRLNKNLIYSTIFVNIIYAINQKLFFQLKKIIINIFILYIDFCTAIELFVINNNKFSLLLIRLKGI
jgi:hypothetical protein